MTRPASAPEVVERGLTVLVLIWQLAWTALDPNLWPQRQSQPLLAVCLALPWLTWLAAVLTTFGPEPWRRWNRPTLVADVLVLCVTSITIVAVSGPEASGSRPLFFSLVLLAVALSGLVLQWRAALVVVVTMAITETALLSWQAAIGDPLTLSDALLNGLQTLYTGVANTGVAAGLRRAAAQTGEAHDALLAATRAEQVADAVERDVIAHERVLHDTVLNTLTAVARGGLEGRDADVRAACRTAADEVRALARPDLVAATDDDDADTGDLADLLFAPVASLRAAGVDVATRGALDATTPREVRHAVLAAATEALRNVERHAGARRVVAEVVTTSPTLRLRIRDDGRGFDLAATTPRLGLTRAVRGSLAQVGGVAEVDSTIGGGTSVQLSWQEPAAARRDALVQAVPQVMAAAMPPLTVPVAVWAGVSLAAAWSAYGNPWLALLGFVLLLALDAVLLLRRPPDWPVTVFACAAAAAIYFLVQAAGVGGAATLEPWGFWASPALLGALIAVAMSGPRWGWALVLATWVAFQGDILELIRPGGALLIAASFASRVVHRLTVSYDTAVSATLEAETRTRAAREARRRRNARYSALTTTVLPLLDDLAAGRLDPHDELVRARCREEERFARTLVRIDPDAGDVPALIVRLAVAARRRGLVLDADLRDDVPPGLRVDPRALDRADAALVSVLAELSPGGRPPGGRGGGVATIEAPRLTAGVERGDVVVRLVAAVDGDPPAPEGLLFDEDDGTGLWEVVLPSE